MDWLNVLLILGMIGLLGVMVVGGKFKASKGGIEVDTKGLLHWLQQAEEKEGKVAVSRGGTAPTLQSVLGAHALPPIERIPRARILWVDDKPLNNLYEKHALAEIGVFADSYTNNDDAVKAAKKVHFQLVISDIGRGLTPESGFDLPAALRSAGVTAPVVFYTGKVTDALRDEATRSGAVGITAEPAELLRLVNQHATPLAAVSAF